MSNAKPMGTHARLGRYYEANGCSRRTPKQNRRAHSKSRRMAGRACRECGGTGVIEVNAHTCGADPYAGYGHEPGCGTEPCPAGCEVPDGQS